MPRPVSPFYAPKRSTRVRLNSNGHFAAGLVTGMLIMGIIAYAWFLIPQIGA